MLVDAPIFGQLIVSAFFLQVHVVEQDFKSLYLGSHDKALIKESTSKGSSKSKKPPKSSTAQEKMGSKGSIMTVGADDVILSAASSNRPMRALLLKTNAPMKMLVLLFLLWRLWARPSKSPKGLIKWPLYGQGCRCSLYCSPAAFLLQMYLTFLMLWRYISGAVCDIVITTNFPACYFLRESDSVYCEFLLL